MIKANNPSSPTRQTSVAKTQDSDTSAVSGLASCITGRFDMPDARWTLSQAQSEKLVRLEVELPHELGNGQRMQAQFGLEEVLQLLNWLFQAKGNMLKHDKK